MNNLDFCLLKVIHALNIHGISKKNIAKVLLGWCSVSLKVNCKFKTASFGYMINI